VAFNEVVACLRQLGASGLFSDGENRLGGMTFWVRVAASNTVEGRQLPRAVVNATANTRVIWDAAEQTVKVQRFTISAAAARCFASVLPLAEPKALSCIDGLGSSGLEAALGPGQLGGSPPGH
jgi:hypothetical protein